MAQIFHPSTNVISRLSIVAVVGLVPVVGVLGYFWNMTYGINLDVPVEQPVEFSHKHHVGDDGIDCRYCHMTVDKAASAGMPSTHTCMTCHSQLWKDSPELELVRESYRSGRPLVWNRVHDLPDFVHFNHSIHVQKGVGCVSCHGQIDDMPLVWKEKTLAMDWCLSCHREPEKNLRPKEYVYNLGWKPSDTKPTAHASEKGKPGTQYASAAVLQAGGAGGAAEAPGTPAPHGAPGSGSAPESGGHTPGAGTDASHSGGDSHAAGPTQEELGKQLVEKYKVIGSFQLTNCSTCHY